MIEQVPTSIKISGPQGIIESVIPTAVSEQFSNSGVHEVHIEWTSPDGILSGTVVTTPLHLTETLDKGGYFEPASLYKHYAGQPEIDGWFLQKGGWSGDLKGGGFIDGEFTQPKADLSQIAADLSKLPAPSQIKAKKKPSPLQQMAAAIKADASKFDADKLSISIEDLEAQDQAFQFAAKGELFMDKHGKSIPIGKVTDLKMTAGGAEIEAKLTEAQVAEHVMRVAAKAAQEVLYGGLANAKDFLPVGNTLNGVEYVTLGGHKYDILLTIKHKEVKP